MAFVDGNLTGLLGGGAAASYLLYDAYVDTVAAGSVNGTLATPGGAQIIGTVAQNTRTVTDTTSKLAVSTGRLRSTGINTANDPLEIYGPFARQAGMMMKQTVQWATARSGGGISLSATPSSGLPTLGISDASGTLTPSPPGLASFQQLDVAADYTLWIVVFGGTGGAGGAIWAQGGPAGVYQYANPTLLWVEDKAVSGNSIYVAPIIGRAVDCQMQADDVQLRVLPQYGSAQALAAVYMANPATGVSYSAAADILAELTFALPGSPSAGDTVELRYRIQDATNYWTAYIKRNAGNTAWDFFLDSVAAGTPTNQISATGVGTPTDIMLVVRGNLHDCFTRSGTTWTKRGAQINSASLNAATDLGPVFAVGTVSLLQAWRRTWASVSL